MLAAKTKQSAASALDLEAVPQPPDRFDVLGLCGVNFDFLPYLFNRIPAQTSRFGQKDVVSILKNYRAGRREEPYIALINRLDQPVEGLM